MRYYRRKSLEGSPDDHQPVALDTTVAEPRWESSSAQPVAPQAEHPAPPATDQATAGSDPSGSQVDLLQHASALVHTAASILDEELATGVLAAYDARRSMPVHLRSMGGQAGTGARMFDAVDNWMGALADLLPQLEGPLRQWIATAVGGVGSREQTATEKKDASAPVLRPRQPARAGGSAQVAFKLHNDDTRPAQFTLGCTDLVSSVGYRVPDHQMAFQPREFRLDPDAVADVSLAVGVPQGTPAGTYAGLLLASGLPYLHAVLVLEVA